MKLSIIIVAWNNRKLVEQCLESIYKFAPTDKFETIVVDNHSEDDTVKLIHDKYPHVRLIPLNKNYGYAIGNNKGIQEAEGEYTLLLNQDIAFQGDAIQKMIEHLDQSPKVGAISPTMQYPDGKLQLTCRTFPTFKNLFYQLLVDLKLAPNRLPFSEYKMSHWQHNETRSVDQPMASCFMIRTNLLKKLEGFDEKFPHYFNDVDLCYRIKEKEKQDIIFLNIDNPVIHHHGASYGNSPKQLKYWNQGIRKFFLKHYHKPFSYLFLNILIAIRKIFLSVIYYLKKKQ